MSFPRKRAAVACDFCRFNFTNDQPPPRNLEDRLQTIEDLLAKHEQLIQNITTLQALNAATAASSSSKHSSPHDDGPSPSQISSAASNNGQQHLWPHPSLSASPDSPHPLPHNPVFYPSADTNPDAAPAFTIPTKHDTMAIRVLALPQIRALVGDYPLDYFYDIEVRRPVPWDTTPHSTSTAHVELPALNRKTCDALLAQFARKVHVHHPIVDTRELARVCERACEDGLDWTLESAILMTALALGAAATKHSDNSQQQPAGIEYFSPAYRIIWAASAADLSANTAVAQGLVLAGLYMAYIVRPISSWKLIHAASTNVQLGLTRLSNARASSENSPSNPAADPRELEIRLFWSCFLIECDRLAEFELPRSGIESIVDDMPLPTISSDPVDPAMVYFLAEISIRRLLNRVHNSLYTTSSGKRSLHSLLKICDELNRQLELWYDSIPEVVRPDLSLSPSSSLSADDEENDRALVLRIRYYATRHIIFRPFVLRVIDPSLPASETYGPHKPRVLENCHRCLDSIRRYIHSAGYILRHPSPYTWTLSQSSLGAILVATAASADESGVLKGCVGDVGELRDIVLGNIRPWSEEGSSIASVVRILEHIQWRQG
ncbi:hypothetical protein BZA70DRAFT_93936 [Myxozyma melibiosi]|uniref:Xylanolytic transcriptional activator regulatory domain-containing protein n=1 Tax=Myxozyma melibiosi TaxID=54550 RepID=A0ABR1EYX0_9ASCO